MPKLSIPDVYMAALDRLASMPEGDVVALRDALSNIGITLKPPSLLAQVRAQIKSPPPDLDEIIKMLVGLSSARATGEVSVDELATDVAGSVGLHRDKPKDYDQSTFVKRLTSLLGVESMALSARATDIQHDYAKVFTSARIISDIRSVFGIDKVDPVAAMIVHNFKVSYYEGGRIRQVFFALDNEDLATLRKVLDRAELKTTQLEQMIKRSGTQYLESK